MPLTEMTTPGQGGGGGGITVDDIIDSTWTPLSNNQSVNIPSTSGKKYMLCALCYVVSSTIPPAISNATTDSYERVLTSNNLGQFHVFHITATGSTFTFTTNVTNGQTTYTVLEE